MDNGLSKIKTPCLCTLAMDPEFRIDQTGGDAALEAAAREFFLFYFDSGFQLLNPVFRPFLQQEDAENFRNIGQHVDLNLIPQPLFPAFIKADVAPRPQDRVDKESEFRRLPASLPVQATVAQSPVELK